MALSLTEHKSAAVASGNITLPSWTPAADDLVLVSVAYLFGLTPVLSGNGLTFEEVATKEDLNESFKVGLYRAMGTSPSTGVITVSLAGNPSDACAACARIAGAATGANGANAVEAFVTQEAQELNSDMKISVTTATDGAWALVVGANTLGTLTLPGGETSIELNVQHSGNLLLSMWYQGPVSPPGLTHLGADGDLDDSSWWAMVGASIKPAPPPPPPATRELVVRAYHGEAGEYLEDWRGFGAVEVTFGPYGPTDARIEVDRHRSYLHHTRSMPGGVGVLLEIDGTGLGAPLWSGRMVAPQFDGDGPAVALGLKGPEEWLSRIGVPMVGATARPAADIAREAIETCRVPTWIVPPPAGASTRWSRVPVDLTGQTIWALLTALAEQRGEEFHLTPRPRSVYFDLDWRHPLDAPETDVVLEHGRNCTLSSSALSTGLPLSDAVGVALSYGAGDEVVGSLVKAPPTSRLGTRDALTAALSTLTVRKLAGAGSTSETVPAPEITSQAALDAMVESMLRRSMSLTAVAQVQDVDPRLWPHLRPGVLVPVRLPDPFSLFTSAIARIRTATFALAPTLGCSLSLELWALEASRA